MVYCRGNGIEAALKHSTGHSTCFDDVYITLKHVLGPEEIRQDNVIEQSHGPRIDLLIARTAARELPNTCYISRPECEGN